LLREVSLFFPSAAACACPLPEEFTRDSTRVRRFEQEARTTSTLNHPNIVTILEICAERGARSIAT
jgi:hypothetical protein